MLPTSGNDRDVRYSLQNLIPFPGLWARQLQQANLNRDEAGTYATWGTLKGNESGTCGDGPESGVKGFTIQTRTQNGNWITVVKTNAKNDGVLRTYKPTKGFKNVQTIRFVMLSNFGDPAFMDVLEVSVRGTIN